MSWLSRVLSRFGYIKLTEHGLSLDRSGAVVVSGEGDAPLPLPSQPLAQAAAWPNVSHPLAYAETVKVPELAEGTRPSFRPRTVPPGAMWSQMRYVSGEPADSECKTIDLSTDNTDAAFETTRMEAAPWMERR